jgi:hypothetical protein
LHTGDGCNDVIERESGDRRDLFLAIGRVLVSFFDLLILFVLFRGLLDASIALISWAVGVLVRALVI